MRITIFAVLLMSLSRDAQLGAQYVGVRATDGNAAASGQEFIVLLNLNIGWSF